MSPAYEAEVGDFIVQQMGEHIKVLQAPERIQIDPGLVKDSPLIDLFILLPGNYLYRVDRQIRHEYLDMEVWEAVRVEKVEGSWTDGKGSPKKKPQ